ncbi:MAG: hypothetical protein MZU97_21405 [Bacillus subtilis]|nr:hypothetical protein [Bacillus subtilis]
MPDATALIDYMLDALRFDASKGSSSIKRGCEANIRMTHGVVFSQRVLAKLLEKGMTREDAYDLIQSIAQTALTTDTLFRSLLAVDPSIQDKLSPAELDACFTLDFYLKHIDTIYQQVFTYEGQR